MILGWSYGRSPPLWHLDSATITSASNASTDREHHGEQRASLQNARFGPGLSADRRYLTLVGIDHLPNTSQPSGWQGATGSSLG
jgi:hypothetical protein